jgi:hypothetical protein
VTSNKKRQGAAIFVGDRHRSATPWQMNYIKSVQAENIITSEPAKLLGKLDFGKRLSVGLRGLSTAWCP